MDSTNDTDLEATDERPTGPLKHISENQRGPNHEEGDRKKHETNGKKVIQGDRKRWTNKRRKVGIFQMLRQIEQLASSKEPLKTMGRTIKAIKDPIDSA